MKHFQIEAEFDEYLDDVVESLRNGDVDPNTTDGRVAVFNTAENLVTNNVVVGDDVTLYTNAQPYASLRIWPSDVYKYIRLTDKIVTLLHEHENVELDRLTYRELAVDILAVELLRRLES